jgi:hypothetical protein
MDWILSVTTLLVNSGLGWAKGHYFMWLTHAVNAMVWILYAITIEQYGLIALSAATILIDMVSASRDLKERKRNAEAERQSSEHCKEQSEAADENADGSDEAPDST